MHLPVWVWIVLGCVAALLALVCLVGYAVDSTTNGYRDHGVDL